MGTLEYNLKFGAQFAHPDDRVWDFEIFELLTLLRVSEELIGTTPQEFSEGPNAKKYTMIGLNGSRLSQTTQALISIARALLSSVDLLLLANVVDLLGAELGLHVLSVLKDMTRHRCIPCLATENAATPRQLRKKKTVIFSTRLKELEDAADNWMFLGDEDAIDEDDEHEAAVDAAALLMAKKETPTNRKQASSQAPST